MQDLYLIHHGVEGQQWGKRNGPPYPLDSAISTGKKLIEKHKQRTVNRAASRIKRRVDKEGYVNRKTREFSFKRDRINASTGLDVKITDGVVGALGSGYLALLGSPSAAIANAIVTAGIIGITEATRRLGNKYYDKKINRYNTAYDLVKNKKISEVKTENKQAAKAKVQDKTSKNDLASRILNDEAYGDRYGLREAKKYGLDQGDNYKMFRDAAAGDEKARQIVEQWKAKAANKK